ncbi:MAG TPA: HK97 family phage prohead protease [Acidimicrobiales bacterium]|nr:HK97 family phage prohead protease [Acidimicrobiales bacterium]
MNRAAIPGRNDVERRQMRVPRMELRAAGDGATLRFEGHACVTEVAYPVYGGPPYGWNETIARGAFGKTLSEKPDVVFLVNHEGLPMARTVSGTLELDEDKTGLHAVAPALDPEDRDVQWIAPKMARGDLDEMSFAFRAMRQEWNEDYTDRRITEVGLSRGDVSIVTYGTNPNTSGSLRSTDLLAQLAALDLDDLALSLRSEGADPLAVLASARAHLDEALTKLRPAAEGRASMGLTTAKALAEAARLIRA